MNKELQIIPPDGYEIDKDKSTLERIVFKKAKKKLDYNDVARKLFKNDYFYTDSSARIELADGGDYPEINESNNSPSREQLQSILALNKLLNVAKYLNQDWLPTYKRIPEFKWNIGIDTEGDFIIEESNGTIDSCAYFKTKELAIQAIQILGEDEIRKALTLNH